MLAWIRTLISTISLMVKTTSRFLFYCFFNILIYDCFFYIFSFFFNNFDFSQIFQSFRRCYCGLLKFSKTTIFLWKMGFKVFRHHYSFHFLCFQKLYLFLFSNVKIFYYDYFLMSLYFLNFIYFILIKYIFIMMIF